MDITEYERNVIGAGIFRQTRDSPDEHTIPVLLGRPRQARQAAARKEQRSRQEALARRRTRWLVNTLGQTAGCPITTSTAQRPVAWPWFGDEYSSLMTQDIETRHARRVFGHGAKGPAIRPSTVQRAQALSNRR